MEFRLRVLATLSLSALIFSAELIYHDVDGLIQLSLAYVCALQLTLSVLNAAGAVNSVHTSLMALNSVDHYMKVFIQGVSPVKNQKL